MVMAIVPDDVQESDEIRKKRAQTSLFELPENRYSRGALTPHVRAECRERTRDASLWYGIGPKNA